MNKDYVISSLLALYAYDDGATDSGIKDDRLKAQCFEWLHADDKRAMDTLGELAITHFLDKESRELGYSIEDVANFLKWLSDNDYAL